jgi:uncharacterized CHY-type Zn-finger protein
LNYEEAQIFFNDKISLENFVTLLRIVADDDQQEGLDFIKDQTACDDYTANLLWAELKNQYGTEETNFILKNKEKNEREIIQEKYKQKMEEQKYRNNAECPYCHSKNTKKISGFSKAGSVALFGVFAMGKVGKQWHCNQCKSDF